MSESRAKLEQILELLLAEDNDRAEEMLHEFVVGKARAEYERVLEAEDDEDLDEEIDQSNDFEDDITMNDDEIDADETGLSEEGEEEEGEEELEPEFGDEEEGEEGEEEGEEGEEGEDDLEGKVSDLEAELAELKADFEALMADDAGDEAGDDMMGDMGDDEQKLETFEYDLEEEFDDEDSEVVEEATKLQDKVAAPKAGADDAPKSFSAPKKTFKIGGVAVPKIKDGSEGDKGANKPKDHTPTDNIAVKPAKAKLQHK
jgi:hypothetical protein